jgi:hypothetical protein
MESEIPDREGSVPGPVVFDVRRVVNPTKGEFLPAIDIVAVAGLASVSFGVGIWSILDAEESA